MNYQCSENKIGLNLFLIVRQSARVNGIGYRNILDLATTHHGLDSLSIGLLQREFCGDINKLLFPEQRRIERMYGKWMDRIINNTDGGTYSVTDVSKC